MNRGKETASFASITSLNSFVSSDPINENNIRHNVPLYLKSEIKFKIILLGNSGVGKTSFLKRICYDHFNSDLNTTIGFDFDRKTILVDDKAVTIELWDTVLMLE